jgi:RNA polymerase sigma-70 factor (ECF subfamily)
MGGAEAEAGRKRDAALVRRVRADDLDAFEEFFLRYKSPIYRTAYGLTGDRQAAEEILQDTFARAYQHRQALRSDVSPLPWLHRVSLNLCYSRLSRRRLVASPIDDSTAQELSDDRALPSDQVEEEELRLFVRNGIATLSEKHQAVIVLYYLHCQSLQETADALGIQVGTVKSRLHYALRRLRGHFEDHRRIGDEYLPVLRDIGTELL